MRNTLLRSQKRGEIVSRFARDEDAPVDVPTWEELRGVEMPPRRAPWATPGVSDEDSVDSASDGDVPFTPKNIGRILQQAGASVVVESSSGSGTTPAPTPAPAPVPLPSFRITVMTGVRIVGTNMVGDFETIQINGTSVSKTSRVVLEGVECAEL